MISSNCGRLHDRKRRGTRALQDPAGIQADLTPSLRSAGAVADQPTGHDEFAPFIHGRHRMSGSRGDKLVENDLEEKVCAVEYGVDPAPDDCLEGLPHVGFGAPHSRQVFFCPSALVVALQLFDITAHWASRVVGLYYERDLGRVRHQFAQYFKPFWPKLGREYADTCHIPVGPVEVGHEALSDWVAAAQEKNRNGRGRGSSPRALTAGRWRRARRPFGEPTRRRVPAAGRSRRSQWSIFYRNVSAGYAARLLKPFVKSREKRRLRFRRTAAEIADHRHRRLLRVNGQRPRCRRAAKCRDEVPSLHVRP